MDILICVGASDYSLERLLKIIDELCEEQVLDGKHIVAQIGCSRYIRKHYKSISLISREEYQTYMDEADVIISHAGTGSVIPLVKQNKKVIVFPRLEKYNEHLDNHQLELAEIFTSAGYTLCATNKEEIVQCIKNIDSFHPKIFNSNGKKFNEFIIDFIDKL